MTTTEPTPPTPSPDTFLTVTELAQRLKVCPRTIANWRRAGLPSITMGRRVLWHWPSVEAYMVAKQRGGTEPKP